jgi:membrane associated rhomboid family serine protease
VGSSGGLMGYLGFLLVFESLHARLVPLSARRRLLAGLAITVLIGLLGYRFIDNAAHAGGLLAGMLYALVVFPRSTSFNRPEVMMRDRVAGGMAALALIGSAGMAVFHILAA